jgi:hypothetical protein
MATLEEDRKLPYVKQALRGSVIAFLVALLVPVAWAQERDRIRSITFSPSYVTQAGITIVVRMEGRAGGQAQFGIQNVAIDQDMQEISRGVYEGRYRVRPGDKVENGAVVVRLQRSGRTWQESAAQRITIRTGAQIGEGPRDSNRIRSITFSPSYVTRAGTTIVVRMEGRAGGRAQFGIQNVAIDQDMQEISRGVYEGRYRVRPGDNVENGAVAVRLERNGRTSQERASARITIRTSGGQSGSGSGTQALGTPRVDFPRPGATVSGPFQLEGQSERNAAIRIQLTYPVFSGGSFRMQTDNLTAPTDREGRFRYAIRIPVTRDRINVQLRLWAESGGRRSGDVAIGFTATR